MYFKILILVLIIFSQNLFANNNTNIDIKKYNYFVNFLNARFYNRNIEIKLTRIAKSEIDSSYNLENMIKPFNSINFVNIKTAIDENNKFENLLKKTKNIEQFNKLIKKYIGYYLVVFDKNNRNVLGWLNIFHVEFPNCFNWYEVYYKKNRVSQIDYWEKSNIYLPNNNQIARIDYRRLSLTKIDDKTTKIDNLCFPYEGNSSKYIHKLIFDNTIFYSDFHFELTINKNIRIKKFHKKKLISELSINSKKTLLYRNKTKLKSKKKIKEFITSDYMMTIGSPLYNIYKKYFFK